ncbi:hypothetical protein R6Q57_008541 [Mikania cordata]
MPRVNTSYDELVSKSDLSHEFPNEPVQLTIDPTLPNVPDVSVICEEKVSVTGLDEKEEEKSARRSTDCSTSSCSSYFVPKTVFVGKFDEIKSKPNDMLKNFKKTFSKNCVPKLISSPLINQTAVANSTVTKETNSQLDPNYEPYVPTTSVEQVSPSSSFGQGLVFLAATVPPTEPLPHTSPLPPTAPLPLPVPLPIALNPISLVCC